MPRLKDVPVPTTLFVALAALLAASTVAAHPTNGTLYYTRFCGGLSGDGTPNIKKVDFDFDGTNFTLGPRIGVATVNGADGLVFAPDGDLLVGAQGFQAFHRIHLSPLTVTDQGCPGVNVFHVMLDPSGAKLWGASCCSGSDLAEFPLNPDAPCTIRDVTGDDNVLDTLAFPPGGTFYISGGPGGHGNFGFIRLAPAPAAVTTQLIPAVPAAHGMTYDPFTGHLILYGDDHVSQIDPSNPTVLFADFDASSFPSALGFPCTAGFQFDQGTVDGQGHLFACSNNGQLLFMDYSASGRVDDPSNAVFIVCLDQCVDDVAPLVGVGAAPQLTCQPVTQCNDCGRCNAVVTYSVTASAGASVDCDHPSGETFPLGPTDVTCTATGTTGAQATCTFTVTITDCDAPVMSCPCDQLASCDNVPPVSTVTATDNCDATPPVTFDSVTTLGSCADDSTITRTWTATDAAGNTTSCTQVITVRDTTAPVMSGCPSDTTISCGAIPPPATVTATDNCDPSVTVTSSETTAGGPCPDASTITRTWTATDRCGNTSTCTQVITVRDTTAPVMSGCPGDVTVSCGAIPAAATVTATDNCDPAPTVTPSQATTGGPCPDSFTITRTWTAADRCGNTSTCTQVITVRDTTAPVMSGCPADTTASCESLPAPAAVTATDDCDPAPIVTHSDVRTDGSCPDSYTITRTWTAVDRCGNSRSCSQAIVVRDLTPPTLHGCPASVTATCDSVLPPPAVTATDNCDAAPVVTFTQSSTGSGCGSVITRTWTATDRCGNASSCTQVVTVGDTTPPVLAASTGVTCLWPANNGMVDVGLLLHATDNCTTSDNIHLEVTGVRSDEYTASQSGAGGPHHCPDAIVTGASVQLRAERSGNEDGRVYTILVSATDACGNVATASTQVHVPHDQSPKTPTQHRGSDPTLPCPAIDSGRNVDATVCN